MAEVVLQPSPSHFPSPSSSRSSPRGIATNTPHQQNPFNPTRNNRPLQESDQEGEERKEREREGDQFRVVAILVAALRRSIVACSIATGAFGSKDFVGMEIGLPTNVRHVVHVTFDRFNGFLGLPVEFEPEVPRRAPSASTTVFGVSTESMQLSYDSRGNSVPTILLMMQRQLYAQGGLQAEGIFRITAGNSQEEYVREQLNRGVIPEGIDVHCLAGLIKAWFRELPTGLLDSLSAEQVMQCQTEVECAQLARLLPPTEAALLDWAVNLMADVAQMEHLNKMNVRNIAMVFAPNMTHMSDPLTALMYAVQVMNFLKNLIIRMLREREESSLDSTTSYRHEPFDENEPQSSSQPVYDGINEEASEENGNEEVFVDEEPFGKSAGEPHQIDYLTESGRESLLAPTENIPRGSWSLVDNCPCDIVSQLSGLTTEHQEIIDPSKRGGASTHASKCRSGQLSNLNMKKGSIKMNEQMLVWPSDILQKSNGAHIAGRINSRTEWFEAWR